jgi:hypothetical protein
MADEVFLIGCTRDICPLKLSLLPRGVPRIDWVELKLGCYYGDITDQEV